MYSFKHSALALGTLLFLFVTIASITPRIGYGQKDTDAKADKAPQNVNVVNVPTVTIGNTEAAAVPVHAVDTHVNRPTSDLVTLTRLAAGSLQRISADGTPEGTEFVVPNGQVLVVTDFSWVAGGDPATVAGSAATFRLLNGATIVHVAVATLGGNGQGGSSEDMSTGIAFGAGTHVRWATTTVGAFDVTVHGYLIPAG